MILTVSNAIPSSSSAVNEDTNSQLPDLMHDAIAHVHPQVKVVPCLPAHPSLLVSVLRGIL